MNTLLTLEQQALLVEKKLAKASVNEELGLVTFKYARKVMYDYLWDKYPELLECRGHTYDIESGELVLAAPRKTFNYLENNYWRDKTQDTPVAMYKKHNGFMATAGMHNGNIVIGTTGTTNSAFANMAKDYLEIYLPKHKEIQEGFTYLYEILHENDPHIVDDGVGVKALGRRENSTGEFIAFGDVISCTLGEAVALAKADRGEGFMLYDQQGNCCKLKTDYYIGKKMLMRMTANAVDSMYNSLRSTENKLPIMWKNIPSYIVNNFDKEYWKGLTGQERRAILETTGI